LQIQRNKPAYTAAIAYSFNGLNIQNMKKTFGLAANRYFIISFAVIVVGLKFLSEYFNVSEKYFSFSPVIKTIFITIYIAAALNILSFIIIALLTKSKSPSWWENLENPQKEKKKEQRLQIYIQSLVISFITLAYGTIIYVAIFRTWQTICMLAGTVIIGSLFNYFQTYKKQEAQNSQ
jgi:mannose/fructose/N-acetylgalactosamine-specific phosphotransferase system component IID